MELANKIKREWVIRPESNKRLEEPSMSPGLDFVTRPDGRQGVIESQESEGWILWILTHGLESS